MKKVIIYPGRFQPMLPHHATVFRTLQANNPDAEVYIATANKVEPGKSPFDAQEKLNIMTQQHDIPQDKIIIPAGNNLYNKDSYADTFAPAEQHSLFFAVGEKDMEANSRRFEFQPLRDGSDSYLQNGEELINTNNAQSMLKHGYVIKAPNVPGISGDVASASAFRSALLSAPDIDSAKETYTRYMGEFNQDIFDLVYDKITGKIMKEELNILKKLAGLLDEAPVNFKTGKGPMDYEPGVSKKDQKSAAERPEKAAASDPNSVGFTKIAPEDMISVDTGKPINSRQRARSMANQFPDGADVNDPAVKKEMFLKLLAQSPGYVLGEINARLENDDEGFAVSDRLSAIIDNLPVDGIMGLGDDDRKWTITLVNNAINNMELHRKDSELDKFDDLEAEPEDDAPEDEPEMVSLDDPEFDAPEDELDPEMEEMKKLAGLETSEGLETDEMKNCGCGLRVCKTTGYVDKSVKTEELDDMRQMAGLERQAEGKMSDIHQAANELSKEEFADEYPQFADDWEDMQDREDPNEPSQDEIDANYEIYKKHRDGLKESTLDLSSVVESIVGKQQLNEFDVRPLMNKMLQKIAQKLGRDEAEHIEKRIETQYRKAMGGDSHHDSGYDAYIVVDGNKKYGPFRGGQEYVEALAKISNTLVMGKNLKFSAGTDDGMDASQKRELERDPKFQSRLTKMKQGLNKADVDAMEVPKNESAPEGMNSDMNFDELADYCGVDPVDAHSDMELYYAPEKIHDDNIEEYQEKYIEDVLLPCANDISQDHAEPQEVSEFQSRDEVDPYGGEPDGTYRLLNIKTGKEVKMFSEIPELLKPNKLVTISPPTASEPAQAIVKDRTGNLNQIAQDKLAEIGYKITGSEPTQGELSLPNPKPHQPELPGMNVKVPVNSEDVDSAIDNALEETMEELKKLAGL
tara:strand:+ start:3430 stop:6177 length:2748 start_codon:yes stop_codon:yes gene_type:complete